MSERGDHKHSKHNRPSLVISLVITVGHTAETSPVVLPTEIFLKKKKKSTIPLLHKTYMRFAKEGWERPEALAPQILHLISKLILDPGSSQSGVAAFFFFFFRLPQAKATGIW